MSPLPLVVLGLGLATFGAPSPDAPLTHKTVWLKVSSPKKWQANVAVAQFGGKSALAKAVNAHVMTSAKTRLAEFLKMAKQSYDDLPTHHLNTYDETVAVHTETGALVSMSIEIVGFTGGAHPWHSFAFETWAVRSGKPRKLRLADLLVGGSSALEKVSAAVIGKLRDDPGAAWVQDGEVRELDKDTAEHFVVTRNGLRFIFAPYLMGPYSSGPISVNLSWAELAGIVDRSGILKGVIR